MSGLTVTLALQPRVDVDMRRAGAILIADLQRGIVGHLPKQRGINELQALGDDHLEMEAAGIRRAVREYRNDPRRHPSRGPRGG